MRAIIYFFKESYINIPANSIVHDCGWVKVYNGDNLVAMFGEEIVSAAYLSEKKGES